MSRLLLWIKYQMGERLELYKIWFQMSELDKILVCLALSDVINGRISYIFQRGEI